MPYGELSFSLSMPSALHVASVLTTPPRDNTRTRLLL